MPVGCGRRARRDRLHFFAIAQGSAAECAAAIDILRVLGHVTFQDATRAKHKLTRILQMLVGLRRVQNRAVDERSFRCST